MTNMDVIATELPGVLLIEPRVFGDERGFFFESWNARVFEQAGIGARLVQDNHSLSRRGILRGLHYQIEKPQGKLIRTVSGEIFDVAVDIRGSSPTFGRWTGQRLSAENKRMLWIPPGFAHGFLALTEAAEVLYKVSDYWAQQYERTIIWNDPDIGIDWPFEGVPALSPRDAQGARLKDAQVFP